MIVPAYNAAEHIEEQLTALSRQRTDVAWELIVADNGCTDGTLAIVDRVAPRIPVPVRVVDASALRGAAAARNAGAAAAAGELLLFTDQDDVVDECWVQELVRALREHPFVGGGLEAHELNGPEVYGWRLSLGEGGLPLLGGQPCVIGCNCGFTAAAYERCGGFDARFNGGGEDLDVSLRMHALGMTAVFAEAAVVHYRFRRDPRATIQQMWGYGVATGSVCVVHGVEPPTFLDLTVSCYRDGKKALRMRLTGKRPVRPVADMAYALGEASVLWRSRSFWKPVLRRMPAENSLHLHRRRLGRLSEFIGRLGE